MPRGPSSLSFSSAPSPHCTPENGSRTLQVTWEHSAWSWATVLWRATVLPSTVWDILPAHLQPFPGAVAGGRARHLSSSSRRPRRGGASKQAPACGSRFSSSSTVSAVSGARSSRAAAVAWNGEERRDTSSSTPFLLPRRITGGTPHYLEVLGQVKVENHCMAHLLTVCRCYRRCSRFWTWFPTITKVACDCSMWTKPKSQQKYWPSCYGQFSLPT